MFNRVTQKKNFLLIGLLFVTAIPAHGMWRRTLLNLLQLKGSTTATRNTFRMPSMSTINRRSQLSPGPYDSRWNPIKWYLKNQYKQDMEEFGKRNTSHETTEQIRLALYRMSVENENNVPIKSLNQSFNNSSGVIITKTGIWFAKEKKPKKNNNKRLSAAKLIYNSYYLASYWSLYNKTFITPRLWNIEKHINQIRRIENEADFDTVFALCSSRRGPIVQRLIKEHFSYLSPNKETGVDREKNVSEALKKWNEQFSKKSKK